MDERIEEITIGIIKGGIGAIPYAGTLVNEMLFDIRSRIKQQRLEKYVRLLGERLNSFNLIDQFREQINNEEFIDTFELISRAVVARKSEEKLQAFVNATIHEIRSPQDTHGKDYLFLQLLSEVSIEEIELIAKYYKSIMERADPRKPMEAAQQLPMVISKHFKHAHPEGATIDPDIEKHNLWLCDNLIRRGILVDTSYGHTDAEPRDTAIFSEIGLQFAEYLNRILENGV